MFSTQQYGAMINYHEVPNISNQVINIQIRSSAPELKRPHRCLHMSINIRKALTKFRILAINDFLQILVIYNLRRTVRDAVGLFGIYYICRRYDHRHMGSKFC